MIGYESASKLLAILVSPCLDVVANNNVAALGSILLNFPYLL